MERTEKSVQISKETERATEQGQDIPFFDSYDFESGKLSLRSATYFPIKILSFAEKYPVKILNASGSDISVPPTEQ